MIDLLYAMFADDGHAKDLKKKYKKDNTKFSKFNWIKFADIRQSRS